MRRLPALIALAGVALLVAWIATNTYWTQVSVPQPLQGDAAINPFYAAQRLAELLGARASSGHEVPMAPPANAVIVITSWDWNLVPSRRERLERWVESGGRLVIDESVFGAGRLEKWTRITREHGNLTSSQRALWSWTRFESVRALRVRVGRGTVTVVQGRPFVKQALLEFERARLFADTTQLRAGDRIYFLADSSGASLLSYAWQRGAPVIVLALCVIALAMWRSSVRFGPLLPRLDPARRSLAEQITGTGRFTVRFGGGRALHAAQVRALSEAASRHVARYGQLPGGERVTTLARIAGLNPDELAQAMNYSGPRRAADLRNALAILEFAQRAISTAGQQTTTVQGK